MQVIVWRIIMLSKKREDRLHWIAILNGLGIILVVVQHCIGLAGDEGVGSPISVWICSFHMPLFFYISGLLYRRKNVNKFIAGKAKALLVSVILFSGLNAVIQCVCGLINIQKLYDFLNFAGFWFVLTLLYIVIVHLILDIYVYRNRKKPIVLVAIVFLILGLYYSEMIHGKEITIATTLVGYFFFAMGVLNQRYNIKDTKIFGLVAGIVFLVLGAAPAQFNIPVMMYSSTYGNVLLFVPAAVCGCIGMKLLSEVIGRCAVIEWFGKNSLIILFTHFPVHRCVMKVISFFLLI